MDNALILLGTLAGVIGTIVGIAAFLRSRKREAAQEPLIQCTNVSVASNKPRETNPIPNAVPMTLENHGDTIAKDINVHARLFVVTGDKFTVPSDDEVAPHFAVHLEALGAGASRDVMAFALARAIQAGEVPALHPDGILVVKTTATYTDAFGKNYENSEVVSAPPPGYEVAAYEHTPPPD